MFIALVIVPIVALNQVGGTDGLAERLAELTPESLGFFPKDGNHINTLLLASSLGWGLGYFGQPHILARFMAIQSPDEVQKSRIIAMVWVSVTLAAAIVVGVIGKAMMPDLADGETVFMKMIHEMFHPVVAGLLMTAILAAIMSTASSQLLVTAASISRDILAPLFKQNVEGRGIVWASRIAVVGVSVVAIIMALDPNSSVFGLVSCAWGGFGSAFGPMILFALFWRRMTRAGAILGMLTGGIVDLVWYNMSGGVFDIYEIIPGFICSSVVIVVVSLVTKVEKEITDEYDSVKTIKDFTVHE